MGNSDHSSGDAKPMARINWLGRVGLSLALVLTAVAFGRAQSAADLLGGAGFGAGAEGELQVSAHFTKADKSHPAELTIAAEIPAGWHIFSITQGSGGPITTQIKLDPSKQFRLLGKFTADPAPKVSRSALYGNLKIETHEGQVAWHAPIALAAGVDPAKLEIRGAVDAQRCLGDQKCLPPKSFSFTAALEETKPAAAPAPARAGPAAPSSVHEGQFQPQGAHVVLHGWIEPSIVTPGSIAKLVLSAEPTGGYHVYALAASDPLAIGLGKPTLIVLTETSGFRYKEPEPSAKPTEKTSSEGVLRYHESPIRWTTPIEIPKSAKPGEYAIAGLMGFDTCSDAAGCDLPKGIEFQGKLTVGTAASRATALLAFRPVEYSQVAKRAAQTAHPGSKAAQPKPGSGAALLWGKPGSSGPAKPVAVAPLTLLAVILFSLLGGLILNLMPCVLPVIGLKILSFVEQGGKSRGHVFALNVWYSLGLMAVFMALASLAASSRLASRLAWGEQFQSVAFNVVLSGIVWVMALSFLGVWEIPIPGFVGSGKAVELAAREGAVGAFAKGALTTVLATPCSGPFLGPVFGYALKQPPQIVYLIFGCIGLGMASPYLVIGAFPRLVRFLPKPGMWMETFKQMMGFVLLGTVVYLFSILDRDFRVPTFALLIGLWAGCWWIGRTPLTVDLGRKLWAWLVGCGFAAAVGVFAFTVLVPGPAVLEWQPFTLAKLNQLRGEGKTVLVDFTAEWCPTCKWNLAFAINTTDVRDVVKANGVVTLVADWTRESEEIKSMLASLKSNSIPVLAIFPANQPDNPIVLRDLVSRQEVIDALRRAGPSHKEIGPVRITSAAAQKSVSNSKRPASRPLGAAKSERKAAPAGLPTDRRFDSARNRRSFRAAIAARGWARPALGAASRNMAA